MIVILLRLDAPLMSFGSVLVDQFNKTDLYPYRAMLVGMIANALGLTRRDVNAHQSIQRRLHYGARRDRKGTVIVDFQTVDFSEKGSLTPTVGWTTDGVLEQREGGEASAGTHIRYRYYVADAVVTVACSLMGEEEGPRVDDIVTALRQPARPLFLGRKCCLPAVPVFLQVTEATSLRNALELLPRIGTRGDDDRLPAIWPRGEEEDSTRPLWIRVEDRDWANAIHVGRSMYVEGQVDPPRATRQTRDVTS